VFKNASAVNSQLQLTSRLEDT